MTNRFDNSIATELKALGFFDAVHSEKLLAGKQTVTVKGWEVGSDSEKGPFIVLKLEDKAGRSTDSFEEAKAKASGRYACDNRNLHKFYLSMPAKNYRPLWTYEDLFRKPLLEQTQLKKLAKLKTPQEFMDALVGNRITVWVDYAKAQNGGSEYLHLYLSEKQYMKYSKNPVSVQSAGGEIAGDLF